MDYIGSMRRLAASLLLLLTPCAAAAQSEGRVAAVTGPATLRLEDGRTVRLAGLLAWPEAQALLERLAPGRALTLDADTRRDRHGRLAAQAKAEGVWLQQALLEAGLARVLALPDDGAPAGELLAIEARARAARTGLWADPRHRPLDAATPRGWGEGFALVEGTVREVARAKERTYLNFGADRKTDFTAAVDDSRLGAFKAAGLDLSALAGRHVRVRGWLRSWNGPFLDLAHPQQIEVLE